MNPREPAINCVPALMELARPSVTFLGPEKIKFRPNVEPLLENRGDRNIPLALFSATSSLPVPKRRRTYAKTRATNSTKKSGIKKKRVHMEVLGLMVWFILTVSTPNITIVCNSMSLLIYR